MHGIIKKGDTMKLNYEKFIEDLKTESLIYLAASKDNKVIIRTVSPLICDNKIYFYTGSDTQKYDYISENNNIAFAFNYYQVEGQIEFIGNPMDEQNTNIKNAYIKKYSNAFKEPKDTLDKMIFCKINLKNIKQWVFDEHNENLPVGISEKVFL